MILRCVRETDDWFGGINIIFAGDFFQLPPVLATPLYKPITSGGRKGPTRAQARERHGQIAWKQVDTVIELTEQKRMERDKEFADAVLRLCLHEPLIQHRVVEVLYHSFFLLDYCYIMTKTPAVTHIFSL